MDILEILKAILFGIIQGITEWLPISSTGHMLLADQLVHLNVSKEFMDLFIVVIQFGSILAVVTLYFHKLNPFSPKKAPAEKRGTWSLWGKVAVASIPLVIIGLPLDDFVTEKLYGPITIAATLIIYGILFIMLENQKKKAAINSFSDLSFKTAFFIGCFQVLAIIPGTSRSGSTILGAVFLGASRVVSAEFSFFLAIPAMFGASGYKLLKFVLANDTGFSGGEWAILLVGTAVAYLVSVFAIKFLMNFIKKHDFKPFGWYRIALGIVVLGAFLFFVK